MNGSESNAGSESTRSDSENRRHSSYAMTRHPIIGQEYTVVDTDQFPPGTGDPDTVVPIGHDDTGNLQVDQYSGGGAATVLWSEEGFVDLIRDGVVVHRRAN